MSKFQLEKLIEVKERQLDDKKKEMQTVVAEMDKISNDINLMDENINSNYDKIGATTLNSNDFYVLKEHTVYLEKKKIQLIEKKESLTTLLDTLRSELFELAKEVKMLEILKSKALKIVKKSENRREQKKLDELALRISERE